MDTLVMSVRCALLILVTSAFVALWSGDHPDPIAVTKRPVHLPTEDRGTKSRTRMHVYEPSPDDFDAGATMIDSSSVNRIANVPLPDGIAAGTYLVVDQFGRSETRVVAPADDSGTPSSSNHYALEMGGSRWHFIRLDADTFERTAVVPTTDSSVR